MPRRNPQCFSDSSATLLADYTVDCRMSYEFLSHTADLKIRARGKELDGAFSSAAQGLREAIAGDVQVKARMEKEIDVTGFDNESLLYGLLDELLFLLDSDGFLFSHVEDLESDGQRLTAKAMGDNAASYKFSNAVKAVTYDDMLIVKDGGNWSVEFVLDTANDSSDSGGRV